MDHLYYICFVFMSLSTSELRVRLARCETVLGTPNRIFLLTVPS